MWLNVRQSGIRPEMEREGLLLSLCGPWLAELLRATLPVSHCEWREQIRRPAVWLPGSRLCVCLPDFESLSAVLLSACPSGPSLSFCSASWPPPRRLLSVNATNLLNAHHWTFFEGKFYHHKLSWVDQNHQILFLWHNQSFWDPINWQQLQKHNVFW